MSLQSEIKKKIDDKTLYENLKKFASDYKVSKAAAYDGLKFKQMQSDMNRMKDKSREEVMALFEEFKKHAEVGGAKVYQAATGVDACDYIAEVCKQHEAKYVVKSKSMTSEEIRLNDHLEKAGVEPIETDLGEWILQLCGEHPSHMVLPAIHKTRSQVAEIFAKYTGKPVDKDDITGMVKIARQELRDYYFKSEVGITGANVAVASTGAIATVTNEGNARLSNTVPPVHIVLMGYEKLVGNFNDAMKVVRMLPKSATGQMITTYVTWVKGQNPSSLNETGTKEVHYVFLDNGRLAFLDHPVMKEALKCIRCGSCANICPAYEMLGGHVFGYIYTGAIGLIMTALFHGSDKAKDIMKLCIGCKACGHNCPAGIDLQHLIFELKGSMGAKYGMNPVKKAIFSGVLANPKLFKTSIAVGRLLQKPMQSDDKTHLKKIPILPKDKDFRTLPAIASESFTDQMKRLKPLQPKAGEKVFFYPGCAIEYFYPDMGLSMVRILQKIGFHVETPDMAVCCGLPAIASGDQQSAGKTIKKNIDQMKNPADYAAYVTLCPSCGMAIKEDFETHVINDPDQFKIVTEMKDKVTSLGAFLSERNLKFNIKTDAKVTYHTPCHLGRGMDYTAADLLSEILGDQFEPLKDSDVCCGFGGSYSIDFASISSGILNKKIDHIKKTEASVLITDCPGCVMQIDGGLKYQTVPVDVMHLSDFIEKYVDVVAE